jgi:hypothetical protein
VDEIEFVLELPIGPYIQDSKFAIGESIWGLHRVQVHAEDQTVWVLLRFNVHKHLHHNTSLIMYLPNS